MRRARCCCDTIEQAVGRERFDAFLRGYFDHFAFRSITTAEFLEYIRRELPNPVPLDEWIFQPGIPAGAFEPHSDVFARIETGWPADTSRLEHSRVAALSSLAAASRSRTAGPRVSSHAIRATPKFLRGGCRWQSSGVMRRHTRGWSSFCAPWDAASS